MLSYECVIEVLVKEAEKFEDLENKS